MKWNESGFRPPLCTYRLNWARRTSWGWWDDWDDTVLQTQDSKFEPWRSKAEHATSRSRRLPAILTFTLAWKAAVLTTTLGPPPTGGCRVNHYYFLEHEYTQSHSITRLCLMFWNYVSEHAYAQHFTMMCIIFWHYIPEHGYVQLYDYCMLQILILHSWT